MFKRQLQGGFTVVELLVAIGLFGMVTPSIVFAIVSINRLNDRASDLTYANVIAESKLESLRSAGYNTLTVGTVDFTSELPATFTAPRSASYEIAQPEAGIKEVTISIDYTEQGELKELAYRSVIGELGVAQ